MIDFQLEKRKLSTYYLIRCLSFFFSDSSLNAFDVVVCENVKLHGCVRVRCFGTTILFLTEHIG